MTKMPDSSPPFFDRLWSRVRPYVSPDRSPEAIEKILAEVRAKTPAPTFWLFGKTQSGKTSIIKYLTRADDAAVGEGFRPCTKTTRQFPFPSAETPLMTFLDTRGVGDPDYDPAEDLATFDRDAQIMIVTAKIADLAQGVVIGPLKTIRAANGARPVVLALTCLHELDPTAQHVKPYPFLTTDPSSLPTSFQNLLTHHRSVFSGLVDAIVPIDLTRPEEGYADPNYGGPEFKDELIKHLPAAYRQALRQFEAATDALKDLHLRAARPIIAGYSTRPRPLPPYRFRSSICSSCRRFKLRCASTWAVFPATRPGRSGSRKWPRRWGRDSLPGRPCGSWRRSFPWSVRPWRPRRRGRVRTPWAGRSACTTKK